MSALFCASIILRSINIDPCKIDIGRRKTDTNRWHIVVDLVPESSVRVRPVSSNGRCRAPPPRTQDQEGKSVVVEGGKAVIRYLLVLTAYGLRFLMMSMFSSYALFNFRERCGTGGSTRRVVSALAFRSPVSSTSINIASVSLTIFIPTRSATRAEPWSYRYIVEIDTRMSRKINIGIRY